MSPGARDLLRIGLALAAAFAMGFVVLRWSGLLTLDDIRRWLAQAHAVEPLYVAGVVVALLFADLFVAMPTLTLAILAGYFLGAPLGAAAASVGMLSAGTCGYALGRRHGTAILSRIYRDQARMDAIRAVFAERGLDGKYLITLVLPEPQLPKLSGFLVPADQGLTIKASTFFTTKWGHLRRPDGLALVRASVGRYGEEASLQVTDAELAALAHREISQVVGAPLPAPVATHVQRWGGALPQYTPGHLERVAAVRAVLRPAYPTLAVVGAAYDGVGIPVCVRSGETGAEEIIKALEESGS